MRAGRLFFFDCVFDIYGSQVDLKQGMKRRKKTFLQFLKFVRFVRFFVI